ncbi:MAG: hypothetical protein COU47_02390 [Candidatus Niyogibacteria bacterium CG10_big_fil_rev_8_21_14_0_10_46_36]|uniref:Uncharacterized protein n=1 Tax=Candidatus Niyogibacteria bacterium CG10_big_fil_rev_8_21_14_0_10_46_36 TaxID=1974726 RepID=A0A2H0TDG4_9BACT|nr:MAG: hypothetical protein COU47_02390 [Candidatus Niyogibacteria bacterium CG10_big_fil_rev_8_21_14_0_10_46_36]
MSASVKKIILSALILGIAAPLFFFALPQKTEASVPVHETALLKEGPYDIAAYTIAKQLWRQLIRDIVGWIQTGNIYGGPLFVQNFDVFFHQLTRDGVAIFIDSLLDPITQKNIPSPFRDIITESAVITLNTSSANLKSSLTGIVPDETVFYKDLSEGGMIGLREILTTPQSSLTGRLLVALDDADRQAALETQSGSTEISSSEGFWGYADCIGWIEDFGSGRNVCLGRSVKTPGSNAQDLLASALESDIDTLEVADELQEIIAAILDRLMFSILDFDLSDASLDPFSGIDRTPPSGGGGSGGGSGGITPPAGGQVVANPVCLTNGTPAINITWSIDTANVVNTIAVVRYCTGQACVPTTSSPVACISPTSASSCVQDGITSGGTYTYKVFVYQTLQDTNSPPLTTSSNVFAATALTCN